jgi:hypothetical protein
MVPTIVSRMSPERKFDRAYFAAIAGVDYAAGLAVNEQLVVGHARVERELTHGHADAGAEVHGEAILHLPPGGLKLLVDVLSCLVFWSHWRESGILGSGQPKSSGLHERGPPHVCPAFWEPEGGLEPTTMCGMAFGRSRNFPVGEADRRLPGGLFQGRF